MHHCSKPPAMKTVGSSMFRLKVAAITCRRPLQDTGRSSRGPNCITAGGLTGVGWSREPRERHGHGNRSAAHAQAVGRGRWPDRTRCAAWTRLTSWFRRTVALSVTLCRRAGARPAATGRRSRSAQGRYHGDGTVRKPPLREMAHPCVGVGFVGARSWRCLIARWPRNGADRPGSHPPISASTAARR